MPEVIDVVVPVYRGYSETIACLESVWNTNPGIEMQLIVVNDNSPDPEITGWLREQRDIRNFTLIENDSNLGFVASVNIGMGRNYSHDVILLNSDTEVADNWVYRLNRAAHSDKLIGTVTPFSNNATICSYPAFCKDNEIPSGTSLSILNDLCIQANDGIYIDIPTAVGFCMYIKRDLISKIGYFDVEKFGKGYGEENDFCCRAINAGYRNILCCDTFVWHKGNVSFGDEHNDRKDNAINILQELHPSYIPSVHKHIQADPAREARVRLDLARWKCSTLPKILLVTHDRGGGTEQHCRELADLLKEQAIFIKLAPSKGGQCCLSGYSQGEAAELFFTLPDDYSNLIKTLKSVAIGRVHFHHFIGLDPTVLQLPDDLDAECYFTAHDYFTFCPQITLTGNNNRYCGELGPDQCDTCIGKQSSLGVPNIKFWRSRFENLITNADQILVPTKSVKTRFESKFEVQNIRIADHPDALSGWSPLVHSPKRRTEQKGLRVAVLGAMSPMKGPDLLESAAKDAESRNLPIQFKLFGYAYRSLGPSRYLEVHGAYKNEELSSLLHDWNADVVWFPAQWPETYSYTLSECLKLGLPVIATDLGAFPDRLKDRPYSWTYAWNATAKEWNNRLLEIVESCPSSEKPYDLSVTTANYYLQNYISKQLEQPKPATNMPDHLFLQGTRQNHSRKRSRQLKALDFLFRLRSHPKMSWLAKKVPVAFQRKIKNKLIGHK